MLFWVQCRNPAILPPNDNIRIVNVDLRGRDTEDATIRFEAYELATIFFGGEYTDWTTRAGPEKVSHYEVRADGMLVFSRDVPGHGKQKGDEVLSHG